MLGQPAFFITFVQLPKSYSIEGADGENQELKPPRHKQKSLLAILGTMKEYHMNACCFYENLYMCVSICLNTKTYHSNC